MRRALPVLAFLAVIVGGALGAVWWLNRVPDPQPVAERFAAALEARAVDPVLLSDEALAESATALVAETGDELGGAPQVALGTVETGEEGRATAQADVTWELASGPWTYPTTVPLTLVDRAWRVDWSPAVLHPELRADQTLELRFTVPPRASILAGDGQPLFEARPIVTVGIQPSRVQDLDATLGAVGQALDLDPVPLRGQVEAADPDAFVEVITLRREEYDRLQAVLRPVPGVVFREGERQLAPTRTFARALLGRVGPPTEEVLTEAGAGFGPGDELGLSGLQRAFQQQLAGRPGVQVVAAGQDTEAVLHDVAPVPGQPLRTTLVPAVQDAAEAAVAAVPNVSALVAVRPSTGEVLAVVNGPDGGAANTAFTGQYPPGSTFKVVSAAALLANGQTPDQPVDCPPTATVSGRSFRNAEGDAAGRVPFAEAFAQSCNTTFAPLAAQLPEGAVAAAAGSFGIGADWNPGAEAYTGQVPPPVDDVERAAEAIGQGRVLASPLAMAAVAAAVADGTWRPPVLLPDHAAAGPGPRPLDPAVADGLRALMRLVVTDGTGAALATAPGPPVAAKTGTAEYGTDVPPRTHAWVIGSRADLAFAVLIDDGGAGSTAAAPLAARFLAGLP